MCSSDIALVDDEGRSLTHAQLRAEGDSVAAAVGGRYLVFCLCTNSIGSVVGYTAFLRHGIVPVMLSAKLDGELLSRLASTYRPSHVWVPRGQGDGEVLHAAHGYELRRAYQGPPAHMDPRLAVLMTTSGSTGSQKLVRQSYRNIRANTEQIVEYLGITSADRAITSLPMHYTFGLSIINTHLHAGGRVLLTDRSVFDRQFWTFCREQEATSLSGVPFTLEMLDKLRFMRMQLPALSTVTQAGGKLSPQLHRKYAEWAQASGKRFIVMYGASEATARMAYLPAEMSLAKAGSCGIAIPRGRLSIADDGELIYEGENVTMGYAEGPDDLAKGDERGGVLRTGDMARQDEDGYFYITGRKKRFLKIFGNRVNLDEVDRLIRAAHPALDCASTGRDDHMVIYVTDAALCDAVRAHVAEKTTLNPGAIAVRHIENIPRNEAGKTLYHALPAE